jgi:hypothetical protein
VSDQQDQRTVQQALAQRYTAPYILSEYNTRAENTYYTTWKNQINRDKAIYKGDIAKVFPEEQFATKIGPLMMNLPMTFSDDLVRLVSESTPSIRCKPRSDGTKALETAHVEEAAAYTYWEEGFGDELMPYQTGDYAVTGCAFTALRTSSTHDYPIPVRIDPTGCYPMWDGPHLVDLMVVEEITGRQAEFRFGDAYKTQWDTRTYGAERVRVVEWYRPDCTITSLIAVDKSNAGAEAYLMRAPTPCAGLTVAGVRRATVDGIMRGMFSSTVAKIMIAARLISQIFDANDYAIYSQPVQRDTDYEEVKDKPWKPITLQTDNATFQIQPPRQLNPQSFQILQFLESQIRAEIGYPEARQGEVSQSIASASFVGSVLGQLTTQVRAVARDLGYGRERWTNLAYKVDKMVLDYEKPLSRPVGKKGTYTPSADFSDRPKCKVIFGTGAGLDKLQQRQAQFQALGYRVISRKTVMGQMEEIGDVEGESLEIDKETWEDALVKQALQDPTMGYDGIAEVSALLEKGTPLLAALAEVKKQRQQAALQAQNAGGPPETAGEMEPPNPNQAQAEQQALQRGGVPGNAPALENQQGNLPPMQDVMMPQ